MPDFLIFFVIFLPVTVCGLVADSYLGKIIRILYAENRPLWVELGQPEDSFFAQGNWISRLFKFSRRNLYNKLLISTPPWIAESPVLPTHHFHFRIWAFSAYGCMIVGMAGLFFSR